MAKKQHTITVGFRLTADEYEQLEKIAAALPALGRPVSVGDAARALVLRDLMKKPPKDIAAKLVRMRTS